VPRKLEELGQIIETARVDKDYSREKLSELVGVSTKHIYNIEHNGASYCKDSVRIACLVKATLRDVVGITFPTAIIRRPISIISICKPYAAVLRTHCNIVWFPCDNNGVCFRLERNPGYNQIGAVCAANGTNYFSIRTSADVRNAY